MGDMEASNQLQPHQYHHLVNLMESAEVIEERSADSDMTAITGIV